MYLPHNKTDCFSTMPETTLAETPSPNLRYDDFDGGQHGDTAMSVFLKALASWTSAHRKSKIEKQLPAYWTLDPYVMVRLWSEFSGQLRRV